MASKPVRLLDAAASGAVGRHGRSLLGPHRSLICLVDGDDERGYGASEGASRLSSDLAAVLTHATDGSNAYDDEALFVRLLVDQLEGLRRSHGTGMTTLGALTVHLSRVVSELVREAPMARKVGGVSDRHHRTTVPPYHRTTVPLAATPLPYHPTVSPPRHTCHRPTTYSTSG